MNLILAHAVFAEKRSAEQAVNRSSSESWNATGKCRKSSLTPPGNSYRARSAVSLEKIQNEVALSSTGYKPLSRGARGEPFPIVIMKSQSVTPKIALSVSA